MKNIKKDFPLTSNLKNIIDPNIRFVVDMKPNYDKPKLVKVFNKKTKVVLFDSGK